ncbi:hypothetical protein GCM10009129_00850 [Psychrobacter aestuarii]|uniref:Lipoprotein n=2 Tax=Psychrobacter aestuarii TaxID=556327 RepID=A0ABP3FAZ9_9GAMM
MKTSFTQKRRLSALACLLLGSTVALSGCQTAKGWLGQRDNGSLDYQDSKKLAPIELPAQQASAPFVPLYQTPSVGNNTLDLTNDAGKQYQLPRPERAVSVAPAGE